MNRISRKSRGRRKRRSIRRHSKASLRRSRVSKRRSKCNSRRLKQSCKRGKRCSWVKRKSSGRRRHKGYCKKGGSIVSTIEPDPDNLYRMKSDIAFHLETNTFNVQLNKLLEEIKQKKKQINNLENKIKNKKNKRSCFPKEQMIEQDDDKPDKQPIELDKKLVVLKKYLIRLEWKVDKLK